MTTCRTCRLRPQKTILEVATFNLQKWRGFAQNWGPCMPIWHPLSVPPFRYDLKIVLTIVWSGRCHFLLSLRTVNYIGRLGNTLLLHSWPIDCRSWPPPPCCSSAAGCTRQVRLTICCRLSFVLPVQLGDGGSGAAVAGSRVCTCAWLVILYFFSSPDNFFADWVISLSSFFEIIH